MALGSDRNRRNPLVEAIGFEPTSSRVQGGRSPVRATPPEANRSSQELVRQAIIFASGAAFNRKHRLRLTLWEHPV